MGVLGIGGLFFRAHDPDALATWYKEHLGIGGGFVAEGAPKPDKPDKYSWLTLGGPVVFQPFKAATDYWPADKQWMLNLRVKGLDTMIVALRASDIAVETKPEWDQTGVGKFARLKDPEGNTIELWEAGSAGA